MKEVISCSRRTDIPSCYYPWLQEALKNNKVELINTFNGKPYTVDLSKENVHSVVLWSKNYKNVIENPGLLENYNLYFQFTINGYSKFLEPNIPPMEEAIKQVKVLAEKYSPEQINWRFDPIIISQHGENVPTNPSEKARLDVFEHLCKELKEFGISRCTISFVDSYGKVEARFKNKNFVMEEMNHIGKIVFARKIVEIAKVYGIMVYSCAEQLLESVEGMNKGHCIDGELLESLFGNRASHAKDGGQRTACGCTKSKDIGDYDKICRHGCLYCYARID